MLDGISSPEQAERWLVLPADIQRLWLGYLVARMRAVKDKTSASLPDLRARVGTVIKRFPTFSARTRPGHVNGLMVSHKPASGTWSGDARNLLQELRAIAWPAKVASAEPRKEPRREVDRADPRDDEPLDWDHRETVASMRIVMFGGSPREEARANLERALGIGSLEWPEGDRPRRVEALTQRIVAGTVDLLLIVRSYVQHKDANKLIDAARVRGTPFALVDAGYGIEAVKAAIGEAMARRSQAS
ncbi:MAG: hypothetical protein HYV09_21840 [Deltaproteobacteria bacterium]|nr:hypothetical protein [Deltaproteobacteria bacterium]